MDNGYATNFKWVREKWYNADGTLSHYEKQLYVLERGVWREVETVWEEDLYKEESEDDN